MTATTHAALTARLRAYPRQVANVHADSEVGSLSAQLDEALAALTAAEQRFRRIRDRQFTLAHIIAGANDMSDFHELAALVVEQDVLARISADAQQDRRRSNEVQSRRHARDTAWSRAATLRETIAAQLLRHNDEPLRHWYRDHGAAMFSTLDRLIGEPTSPEHAAAA